MKRRQNFSADTNKRLSNPAYTGVRVHPSLIETDDRNYDAELFMHMVHQKARQVGSEKCLRDFMKALRLKDDEWASLIPIHASFAEPRPVLMGEEEFIATGVKIMLDSGVTKYFSDVIENLSQGIIIAAEVQP